MTTLFIPEKLHQVELDAIADGKGERLAGWWAGRAAIATDEDTRNDLRCRAFLVMEATREHERAAV